MSIIKELFDIVKNDLTVDTAYRQAKNRLSINNHTSAEINSLRTFLNDSFYNKESSNYNKIVNATSQYLSNYFNQTIDSYDFGSNLVSSANNHSAKIELKERTNFGHSGYTYQATIKKKMNLAKTVLESIQGKNSSEILKVKKDLEELILTCQDLLSNGVPAEVNGSIVYEVDKNKELINKIDILFKAVTFYNDMPLSLYETGYIFEKSLQALNLSDFAERSIDEILNESFNAKTAGMQSVKRGQLLDTAISYKMVDGKPVSKDDTLSLKYIGKNGSSYSINSVFSAKQGKMDVSLTLPSISEKKFQVSAKNWKDLKNSDFGGAYLLDAILRTTGSLDYALAYGVSFYDLRKQPQRVHNFAKMSAVLDILAGISQKEHFADVIVINNRSNKEILVYSIPQLVDNIYKLMTNNGFFKLSGYKSSQEIKQILSLTAYKNKRISLDAIVNGLRQIYVQLKYSNLILS